VVRRERHTTLGHIYADQACLFVVACQCCQTRFKVAASWSSSDLIVRKVPSLVQQVTDETLHYGDPPNMGCCSAGPTMNSEPVRVLEFWARSNAAREWLRVPKCEVRFLDADD
jgi:hypothetical protein